MFMKKYFCSPTRGKLTMPELAKEIRSFIEAKPNRRYKLVIGSDSQEHRVKKKKELGMVAAVVIYREGKGGRYFYQRMIQSEPHSLRDKIYRETILSVDVAHKLLPILNKTLNGRKPYELEIHIDVGEHGRTKEMIKEVVGMVNGNGYKAKTKPRSYCASNVADKYA
jgi:hypothetical protein